MEELNSSMEEAELSKTLKMLQSLETEKEDIVLGFIKEKEIIESIHQEQLDQLKSKHEEEIQAMRKECFKDREKLLREIESRQVEAINYHEEKTKEIEKNLKQKSKGKVKETEDGLRKEKRKLRQEYESVIAQKTAEIEELYRENCILRSKSDPHSFENKIKEAEIMINTFHNKIKVLEKEKVELEMKLKNDFEVEKADLERKHVRDKAEFVKQLNSQFSQQNTSNQMEKNKSFLVYQQEMKEKIEIVERLWEERNTEDRKKMNTRLQNEIAVHKERSAEELLAKLSERDITIESLEREKEELANSIHVERFELAKFYNRELSILNRLDSPTKEDIEVALIDEVAKLRDEQQKVIRNLEKRHKRKMRDLKQTQKPLAEIEEQHKNEMEELRNSYEKEKEEFEAQLRNEQLNLLKSFEFEKNDIERYFKQLMDEREDEFQNEIQALQSEYENVTEKLTILEKENNELNKKVDQEKERSEELVDKLQECESQNARLKEELEKDKRRKREPVKEKSANENDREVLKETVEKLSSVNVQLSDELEKERKRCENILEKVHELEKEREHLLKSSEADEVQSSESGLELSTSLEKPADDIKENDRNTESSLGGKSTEKSENKPESKVNLDMQMKLEDSIQEYLLEIKVLQDAMNEKEMEIKQIKDHYEREKRDLNKQIQDLNDALKSAVDNEDTEEGEESLEDLKTRHKKLTDAVNRVIKDLDKTSSTLETPNTSSPNISGPSDETKVKDFSNEVNALDDVLGDELDAEVKEKFDKRLKTIKNNITRSHALEKLEQERKHEQEKNRYLKELSDERHKELEISGEVWNAVCEKLGLAEEESKENLKEILQEKGDQQDFMSQSETKSEDANLNSNRNMGKSPDSEELKKMKEENEALQRALDELEKHYKKEKEELMEKLQTQHKEFVLASEAEVIEKLIKEKTALEEASHVERFNLSSLYYMEMQDELEEILSQRKEDTKKEHEKEKLDIILKFNKDIADLHKYIAEKDENELKLLQEKNDLSKKILGVQRRMRGKQENTDENNINNIKAEAEKLEAELPLKKELAELQRQRQEEHETNVQNLEEALDLINNLLKDETKADTSHRRYRFMSASGKLDEVSPRESPTSQRSSASEQMSLSSGEEIRTKEDLQKALENLIENSLPQEKDEADSDSSSGASSDFESEPNTPPPESEEGVSDSGAESIENDCVSIKKADLELAMNLERFSLGRIYYNEYKDSLKSALKKLAKEKNKNQDLEDKLKNGITDLVNRTNFGKMIQPLVDMEAQSIDLEETVEMAQDKPPTNNYKDTLMDIFSEAPKEETISAISEDAGGDLENVERDKMYEALIKEICKADATTQTDDLEDHIIRSEQPSEEKERADESVSDPSEVKSQENLGNAKIAEPVCEQATSHMLGQQRPENEEIGDYFEQEPHSIVGEEEKKPLIDDSKDESMEKEEIEQKKKSNEDEEDRTENKGCVGRDPILTSGDEKAEDTTLTEELAAEKEKVKPEKKSVDDEKEKKESKEFVEQEQKAIPRDEEAEDTIFAEKGDGIDVQKPLSGDRRTKGIGAQDKPLHDQKDEGIQEISAQEEDSEVLGQDNESDEEKLARENKELKDKFNILKALVGKWFVEEIPELRSVEKARGTEEVEKDNNSETTRENQLKDLREEEKCLAEEIKNIDNQISKLKDMNDANNRKEEEKINAQELLALKQLEKADEALKKEEEKDLIELLKKEKIEVCKKLDELESEIEEHKGQISDNEKSLFDLMSKRLELEESVARKAKELEKNQKKLQEMKDDEERKKMEKAVLSLEEQKKILEDLQNPLHLNNQEESPLVVQQHSKKVEDDDTNKDLQRPPSNFPFEGASVSRVKELIKAKASKEKEEEKLAKKIEKAKRDKERYNRMTKDREDRIRPFIKKRARLLKNLKTTEGLTDENVDYDDGILSTIENKESDAQNKTNRDGKSMENNGVEEIEKEIIKVADQISSLSSKAKTPYDLGSKVNVFPSPNSQVEELELEKDMISSEIEIMGCKETAEIADLLEEKAKLEVKLLEIQESFPEGYEELPLEVKEAYKLACLKQEIENALSEINQGIKQEEEHFRESVIYQREGRVEDPHSAIGSMFQNKQKLSLELEQILNKLASKDDEKFESGDKKRKFEDRIRRKREIENVIKQNEEQMKDEPSRAATALGNFIEDKQSKAEELLNIAVSIKDAKENLKMAEFKEKTFQNIPESFKTAITLEDEADEYGEESLKAAEQENYIKDICQEIQSLKSEDKDTKQKEDELLNAIEKQIARGIQSLSDRETKETLTDPVPSSLFVENESIRAEIKSIKGKLDAITSGQNDEDNIQPELDELTSLFQKKAELDKAIKDYKELNYLLNQKRELDEALKTAVTKNELNEIEKIIERKEEEIARLKAMDNEVEDVLGQLNESKNDCDLDDDKLKSGIEEALKETQKLLVEAQAEKKRYYETTNQEESSVKEAMSSLEDELEETREEMEFVENELEGLRHFSDDDNAVSPELLELTKLLNTQKSLKDYLFEIDTKLDNSEGTAKTPLSQEELQALKKEKRDAESKLKEIQEQKSKFEVELQDDDILETYTSLCEEKARLVQARKDLMHQIHGSNVFGEMADELEEGEPSEEEKGYYSNALNKMLSEQKTLIKLAEENEKLKHVACRQRELLENLTNCLSASLGEDLAQAITSNSTPDENKNTQVSRAIMDRINNGDETIAEILNDLENENKNLGTLNNELSKEFDCLTEKIGETLLDAILQSNNQLLEDKLMGPIDELAKADKTVEEILDEQRDALERLKDVIGENLTDTLLKPKADVSEMYNQEFLRAPKIMHETDDDLETVIAAYEFQLDNIGKENDLLKTMLGNDLVHALLGIDQDRKNKHIPVYDNVTAQNEETPEFYISQSQSEERCDKEESHYVQDKYTKPGQEQEPDSKDPKRLSLGDEDSEQLSQELKTGKPLKSVDVQKDKTDKVDETKESQDKGLQCQPELVYSGESEEKGIEMSHSLKPYIESNVEKYGFAASVRMAEGNKTLGEIIKGYESDLDTLKARLGPDLYKEILRAEILDEKNADFVTVEDKMGEGKKNPSDDSAIHKEGGQDSDNNEDKRFAKEQDLSKQKKSFSNKTEDKNKDQWLLAQVDDIDNNEKLMEIRQNENVTEKPKSERSMREEKALTSKEEGGQLETETRALAAPKMMFKGNQTLAEVIEGYENDLETLKLRLGPELYENILEKQYIKPVESETKPRETQRHEDPLRSEDVIKSQIKEYDKSTSSKEEKVLPLLDPREEDEALPNEGSQGQQNLSRGKRISPIGELEDQKALKDTRTSEAGVRVEEDLTSSEKQKDDIDSELHKPQLAAPRKMSEENKTLAEVIEGYENDLEILKSRLGPELYKNILDAEKQCIKVESKTKSEETRKDLGTDQEEITASQEKKNVPYFERRVKDDLQETKETPVQQDGDQAQQTAASGKPSSLASEFEDDEKVLKDTRTSEAGVRVEEDLTSSEKQKEDIDLELHKPQLAAPRKVVEENKTLAEVIEGYENDLSVLKSRLGPELYKNILDAEKHCIKVEESKAKPEETQKDLGTDQEEITASQEKKNVPYFETRVKDDLQETKETPVQQDGDQAQTAASGKPSSLTGELEEERAVKDRRTSETGFGEEEGQTSSEKQKDDIDSELYKPQLAAPRKMSEENKTLAEVIEGYENDLSVLKSRLGPELYKNILDAEKQCIKVEESKAKPEETQKDLGTDQEEITASQEKKNLPYFETRVKDDLQKTETPVPQDSDQAQTAASGQSSSLTGELEEERAVKDRRTSETGFGEEEDLTSSEKQKDDIDSELYKPQLAAPRKMSEENKTLAEVIEGYENDLEILKSRLGPELYKNILDAEKQCIKVESKTKPEETRKDLGTDQEEITASQEKKNVPYFETRVKDDLQKTETPVPQDSDQAQQTAASGQPSSLTGELEEERAVKDRRTSETCFGEKEGQTSSEKQKEDIDSESRKPQLAAPMKMVEENQTLAKVIEEYENELSVLKSRLGPELYKTILDAGKQSALAGESQKEPGETQKDGYPAPEYTVRLQDRKLINGVTYNTKENEDAPLLEARSGDDKQTKLATSEVYKQPLGQQAETTTEADSLRDESEVRSREEEITSPVKRKENENFPSRLSKNDLKMKKEKVQPNDQRQAQLNAASKEQIGQSDELVGEMALEDTKASEALTMEKKDPATVKQRDDTKELTLFAPLKMIDNNQTLAEVIKGYENDLQVLKSRLGPELYAKILETEKMVDKELPSSGTEADNFKDKKQQYTFDTSKQEVDDVKERVLYDGRNVNKGLRIADRNTDLEDDEFGENEMKNIGMTAAESHSEAMVLESQSDKFEISAPKQMIEENKTLGEIIKDYEMELETLKSNLGPELYNSMVAASKYDDGERKEEMLTDEQLLVSQIDDSKIDASKQLEKGPDDEEYNENNQAKDQESGLSEGETYLSDGELYQSFNIPNISKESPEIESTMADYEPKFSAPLIMAKQGKTLGEVMESYENDLETLKSKLGPNLFERVLDIGKQDGKNIKAGVMTDSPEKGLPHANLKLDEALQIQGAADDADTDKHKENFEQQEGGVYDEERSEGEMDGTLIKEISQESDFELPSKHYDLAAPKQMMKENKTLEDVIQCYEDDLQTLKESLGQQLCNAVLTTSKPINESGKATKTKLKREEEDLSEPELNYFEMTTDAKGKMADNVKRETGKVILESEPREEESTQDMNENNLSVDRQEIKHGKGDARGSDKQDIKESDQDQINLARAQKLEAPKMIAQGKRLEDIIGGYENELEVLKSRIGPELYTNIVSAGKKENEYDAAELPTGDWEELQPPEMIAQQRKDENVEDDSTERKDNATEQTGNIINPKKGNEKEEAMTREGRKDDKAKKMNEEQENLATDVGISDDGAKLIAVKQMIEQDKTLEDVLQGYEKDLAALNSKLGPDLFKQVLEVGTRDNIAIGKPNYRKDSESEVDLSQKQETEKNFVNVQTDTGEPDRQTKEVDHETDKKQVKDAAVRETKKELPEEINQGIEVGQDGKTQTDSSGAKLKDTQEKKQQPSNVSKQLKAPILIAEQEATLQEIIEKYETDLDVFKSRLGPNLTKAILKAGEKESTFEGDEEDVQPESIYEVEPDFYQPHDEYTVRGKHQFEDKEEMKTTEEDTEKEEEMKHYSDMMSKRDLTLEDIIKKLQKESDALKGKNGPSLTKKLMEDLEEDEKKLEIAMEKESSDNEIKDLEKSISISDGAKGTAGSKEEKEETPKRKAPSQDAIQNYEDDLSTLKKALGPNLVNILLHGNEAPAIDNMSTLLDVCEEGEEKEFTRRKQSKEDSQKLSSEKDKVLEELRQVDQDEQEKTERDLGEIKENKGFEQVDGSGIELKSEKLETIISPLLTGGEDKTLEDILRKMHSEVDVLKSKLGANLSKSLLTMDSDLYHVTQDKELDDNEDETGATLQIALEDKVEREKEGLKIGKGVKEIKKEDKEANVGEVEDLAAVDRMEENSLTLEEVIKQYENNLEKYETSLGPYLSEAILTKKESVKDGQEKSNVGDKDDEEDAPPINLDSETKDKEVQNELKDLKIEKCLKLLDKGKTLEDLLLHHDQENEAVILTKADELEQESPTISDEYGSDELKRLRNQNIALKQELDDLNSKLGKGLANELKFRKDKDLANKKSSEKPGKDNTKIPQECDKETPEEGIVGISDKTTCSLEAPKIMAKYNQTLEDVVAEYENNLKEAIKSQEQIVSELVALEQCIGPNLYKELGELRKEGQGQEVELGKDTEDLDKEYEEESAEKPEEQSPKKRFVKSNFDAINRMAVEEKPLVAVLEDYKNELEAKERENTSLKKALESVSGDGPDFGEIIAKYENQITMLENANREAENNFEDKHNELQNEIDDLRSTLEKLAQTLRQDFLDDLMKQDESDNRLEALQIMEKENKTLAEVVEEYEDNMKKLEREKAVLQQIAGQGEEGASMLDTINEYEDAIKGLKEVNKILNKRIDALTDKLGSELSKQIMDLCDSEKKESGEIDDEAKQEVEPMDAVKEMKDKNISLEEVLKSYEDQNKRETPSLEKREQSKTAKKEIDEGQDTKVTPRTSKKESDQGKGTDTDGNEAIFERIGMKLVGDIKELDNRTYEELEKEDKRPYALRTMKARNEKLEDVIKAYEKTLSEYGLLDTGRLKEESLASELQAAIEENITVEEISQYGAQGDHLMERQQDEGKDAADEEEEEKNKEFENLRQQLEEEKVLKEKYKKDAEDLLNDIVKLKMKNASGDVDDMEKTEKQIKEEYEQKQENRQMREDLSAEKSRSKELENENNELKAEIRNMERKIKDLENALEKMQGSAETLEGKDDGEDLAAKVKKLLVKNEDLEKDLKGMKNQLKENEENHKNEKIKLMEQSEEEKRAAIKSLLEAKGEVEIKLQEQLALSHELEEKLKQAQEELNELRSKEEGDDHDNVQDKDQFAQLKMKNESLKEQLDFPENATKEEIEKAKLEDDKKHEIDLLNNKLELEKAALEGLKDDYNNMLKREKERQLEDFEKDLERERRRFKKDLEEQAEDFERKQNSHRQELEDANQKAQREKDELRNLLQEEKEKLQKMFDEQMRQKDEDHEKVLDELRQKLEDQLVTEKAEMNVQFRHEKTELKNQIEKDIYGEELQKNIDLENDFQETLNKVLKEHADQIAEIEKEMRQAEEQFREQKLQLLEEFENEKEKESKQQQKEKKDMESTIENLLKEIIKLKHQRKEMRQQYRVEKQNIEEFSEKERIDIQETMERSKNEMVTKLKQDHEKEIESEKEKYEVIIKELQEALDRTEAKRKELEEKWRSESLKAEESSLNNKSMNERPTEEISREVKVIKRGIEMEYEQKLSIEKQRFEDTLQGLKREVGNLQEKRKIIQERVYNQETHASERHIIEKSIANYKLEVLSKLEGEMAQRIERERKPLEEEVKELQIENEELKHQRWEMKAQFRREKAALEETFEREKEMLENNFNKEKEELRKRLETKLQKEKHSKGYDVKVSRATSPVPGEPSPRIDNTVRMLKQENLSLVSQNAKHENEIEQLNEKLKYMEMNFREMMETEKIKAEKMKRIQERFKTETVDPVLAAPKYKPPSAGAQDDSMLHALQEKDQQIHQLMETKKYYEEVLSELCDEAGLFELDRNQIV